MSREAPELVMKGTLASDTRPSARAWLVLALLWVVGFSCYLTRNLLTTMHGSLVAAIPMSDTQFGLLTSVFLWNNPFAP